jgi:hypothetical protein
MTTTELRAQLTELNLKATAAGLDDLIARAAKSRWSAPQLLEELARIEIRERADPFASAASPAVPHRPLPSHRRFRLELAHQNRPLHHRARPHARLHSRRQELHPPGRQTVSAKPCSLKTSLTPPSSPAIPVLFRTAPELLADLHCDSPQQLRRKLSHYARPDLLVIDEVGYLSYDAAAADLLYEVVNRRYEHRSILMTTNKAFKDWNTVFPNATSIATLLDRLTHHVDIAVLEGQSYRVRESELEIAARRKKA